MSQSQTKLCVNKCSECSSFSKWIYVHILIVFALTTDSVAGQHLKTPSSDFSRHRVVTPLTHHARTKREISTTRDTDGAHHSEVTLTVNIDGEDYVLDLRLNKDLISGNHTIQYQKDGSSVTHRPKIEDLDICQYNGYVRGKQGSWAAVSTCNGVRGVIYDGTQMRYIEPARDNSINSAHYIYDHSSLQTNHKCGYNGGITNSTEYDPLLLLKRKEKWDLERSRISRHKRSSDSDVRGPYNSNQLSRYVELVLVADYRSYQVANEDINTVHRQLKDVANIIYSVYAPLNIFIALVGVVVWSERDEIILEENGDESLAHFLHYRKTKLIVDIPNDNAHLLTRQKFQDGVVGKALKGPICTYEFSGGIATNHSDVIGLVATTIAHEMGHNFGMEHDTEDDCKCPDEKCIMSPSSTSVTPVHWSTCSLKSLALAFEKGMDYCLRNKPTRLFESPTCGNGFVEPGEQCDCGLTADKNERNACHMCCDPGTCMLRSNATCASGLCCDLETCRPKRAGTVCRWADKECDLPEYCSGYSEFCPSDVFKMDSTPCGKRANEAFCVQGSCRSHADQCRLLWGTTGETSHDKCYYGNNIKGNKNGNCGYDRTRQIFYPCEPQDTMCGMLHCRHLNERLEFGMESVASLSAVFINNNGTIIPCRTAIIDLGLNDVDPGLVPDGAKCGEGKMCLHQQCISVDVIRSNYSTAPSSVCPSDCSGHGVCNSAGHCHCEPGFAPPLCELPGPGGSYDSGPATDPSLQRNFMVAMYVIFLGIVPSILLILLIIYYSRHNVLGWWKRPRKSVQSPKKASLPRRLSRSATKFAANFQTNQNNQTINVHTLSHSNSNPDDSSSLLRSDSDRSPAGNVNPNANFFGHFKGFSLTPVEKENVKDGETKTKFNNEVNKKVVTKNDSFRNAKITPVHRSSFNSQTIVNQGVLKPVLRTAPPLPVVPTGGQNSPKSSPSVKRNNSAVQNRLKQFIATEKTEDLTPPSLNLDNQSQRPVISSPILEASTCTAKELISPLQGSKTLGPSRAAPTIPTESSFSPNLPKRPLSMHAPSNVLQKPLPEEPKKVKEGISLNRIASFLKHEKPKERTPVERSNSMPRNPNNTLKLAKDKVALRDLQISNPILQKDIDLPGNMVPVLSDSEDDDKSLNRTQSMRAPIAQKPVLQSFGSMRQAPGAPRPISGVGRPTAPPPPLPEAPMYQNPKPQEMKNTDYVDCIEEEEKQAPLAHIDEEGDNIYAVIEESPVKRRNVGKLLPGVPPPIKTIPQAPPEGYLAPKAIATSASGSTESMGLLGEIVNEIQNRNLESIYSASTLSRKKKAKEQNENLNRDSTYVNDNRSSVADSVYSNSGAKSNVSTTSSGYLHPSAVNVPNRVKEEVKNVNKDPKVDEKAPPSPVPKPNTKIPSFARQVTPPGLKTTTFRNVPQSPKNTPKTFNVASKIVNSPDIVSSCGVAETKNPKPPDVINNNKLQTTTKPSVLAKPNDNRPPIKTTPVTDKKSTVNKSTPSLKPVNSNPNLNKTESNKNPALNRVTSKVDSNVKAIADNLNKNRPKVVPKPANIVRNDSLQKTEATQKVEPKTNATKLTSKPSNVASLQQKFENRKSIGKDITTAKK